MPTVLPAANVPAQGVTLAFVADQGTDEDALAVLRLVAGRETDLLLLQGDFGYCSWHKNQRDMQIGGKGDETGWAVYEACRRAGGFIATGHEHSYSRTYLMSNFRDHAVVHRQDTLEIEPGQSFAFVSGLGGHDVRDQRRGGDWWASSYSATQGASPGALFCTFLDSTADCWFEDIAGAVPDRFSLVNGNVPGDGSPGSLQGVAERPDDRPVSSRASGATGPAALIVGLLCLLFKCYRLVRRSC